MRVERCRTKSTVHAFGTSVDPEQRFLYIVDGSNKVIRIFNRQTMEQVGSVGERAGHDAREFFHRPPEFVTDSKAMCSLAKSTMECDICDRVPKGVGPGSR